MPLDPARYPFARLKDPDHKMPFRGRLFGANADHPGFERVDLFEAHTQMLIAGGSIELVDAEDGALNAALAAEPQEAAG